ncbi:MAG: cation-transporting P-type ATPase, partial [Burkholderiaceae bacterium]|nr:cation-transporting P-type ATPase [Burkholderiaceae bacterium]
MDCAAEESEIRRALDPIAGIRHVRFDLGQRQLDLSGTPQAIEQAAAAMRRVGFDPQPLAMATAPGAATPGATADSAAPAPFGAGLWRLVAALGLAVGAEALAFFAPDLLPWRITTMALALAAIALAGLSTYKKGFAALRAGRLNINALMTVAVTGAFVIGQWPEAAMVMALYAIAELIEARAVDRARNAIRSLLALAPEDAEVRQADGTWLRVATAAVAVGAIVRIRPGERVPLDGRVTEGRSAIDQAPVTGESIPVDKGPGDEVYAGTINQAAALEMRVTAPASDSTLARIIHAVEQAQG